VTEPARSRIRRRIGLGSLAVLIALVTVVGLSRVRVQTGVESFLPSSDTSVTDLDSLARSFGGEPVVVLLESAKPKQLLDQEHLLRLLRLEGALSELPDVATVYGPATLLNQIAGQMQNLLAELSGRRDAAQIEATSKAAAAGASTAAAAAVGKRARDAFDVRYGPLLVQGLPAGLPTLRNATFVDSVIFSGLSKPRAQWRFVVPSASAAVILVRPRQGLDAGAAQRLVSAVKHQVAEAKLGAARTTISGAPTLAAAMSSQVAREAPMLGAVGVSAIALCFLLLPWTRRSRRFVPLASTLAAIAMTLSLFGWLARPLSLGVVAFLPVLMGIGSFYPTYFARRTQPRVVWAIALATAASFATLALSPLPVVRDLGITLAVGVTLSCLVGYVTSRRAGSDVHRPPDVNYRPARPVGRAWFAGACVVGAVLMVCGWSGLQGMRLQTDFGDYAAGLPALADADHVQRQLKSSGELDIVLRGPDVTSPAAFQWMRSAQTTAITNFGDRLRPIVSIPSLLDFMGAEPTAEQIAAGVRFIPDYLMRATMVADHRLTVLSFGVDINDVSNVQRVIDGLRAELAPPPDGYRYEIAGLPVAAARGAQLVSADRYKLNVLGIAASASVLLIGLRRRVDALRAAATSVAATGIGFSLLWFFDIALSPITAALGALTAAVAAEFAVMLSQATHVMHQRLRVSIWLAVTTSSIGYLSLTTSQLSAIREFGLLLSGAVVLAFGCALAVVRLTHRRAAVPLQPLTVDTEEPLMAGVLG
jgi:hypothetical protein